MDDQKSVFILRSIFQCSWFQGENVCPSERTFLATMPKIVSHSRYNQGPSEQNIGRVERRAPRPSPQPDDLAERAWGRKNPNTLFFCSPISCQSFPIGKTQTGRSMWQRFRVYLEGRETSPHPLHSVSLSHVILFRASEVTFDANFLLVDWLFLW